MRGRGRREDGARVEIWIRPSGQVATPSSQRGGSESSRDSEQDGELSSLSASEVRELTGVFSRLQLNTRESILFLIWSSFSSSSIRDSL